MGGRVEIDEAQIEAFGVRATPPARPRGLKHDQDKPRLELVSRAAMEGLGRVLGHGAQKYAAHNWRNGLEWSRVGGAALRHLMAFLDGEDLDPQSGLPHIDHALAEVMFLSEYQKRRTGTDDRHKGKSHDK